MIDICSLVVQRGSFVLGPVDLRVAQGECLVIMGTSGAGKTLLVETVLGLHVPERGQVFVAGEDVTDLPPERRGFSYLPQDLALFSHLGVEENIAFAWHGRAPREEVRRLVREVAESLGITHLLQRRSIAGLSGGERQRVALARALVAQPRVLFLDEPFNSLDRALRVDLYREFGEIRHSRTLTTVLVTHDIEEAFALGNRMAVMVRGRVEQVGPVGEVYARPKTRDVARLMIVENMIEAEALGPADGGRFFYGLGDLKLLGPAPCEGKGRRCLLGVRARHVRIAPTESEPHVPNESTMLHATVRRVCPTPDGALVHLEPRAKGAPLLVAAASVSARMHVVEGAEVMVRISAEDVFVLDAEADAPGRSA